MAGQSKQDSGVDSAPVRFRVLVWVSGAWILPLLLIAFWILPASVTVQTTLIVLGLLLSPLPALLYMRRQRSLLMACSAKAEEDAAQLDRKSVV